MDSKPALDPHQEYICRLRDFGYNKQEARFLYLAATHSGYFTRHQFLSFTDQTKGCLVHRFTTRLLTQHHAQATQYGHKTYVFKLLQPQNSQAETKNNSDAGKSTPWPGATPVCPRFSGPKRPPGFRVAPGHSVPLPRLQFGWQVCHPQSGGNVLPELS